MTETLNKTFTAYDVWLDWQSLAAKTRVAYRLQVHPYEAYLAQHPPTVDDPLHAPTTSDYAVRDYKTYLTKPNQPPSILRRRPLTISSSSLGMIDCRFGAN